MQKEAERSKRVSENDKAKAAPLHYQRNLSVQMRTAENSSDGSGHERIRKNTIPNVTRLGMIISFATCPQREASIILVLCLPYIHGK